MYMRVTRGQWADSATPSSDAARRLIAAMLAQQVRDVGGRHAGDSAWRLAPAQRTTLSLRV
jgi:hypothetical protein